MDRLTIILLYLVASHVYSMDIRVDPLVLTDQGLVRGTKATDGDYSFFYGIPYAKVDLDNPFGPALKHPGFDEVFEAYDGTLKCPQLSYSNELLNTNQDLDCLTLNIYSPNSASANNPLPVLVFIHGGSFTEGYSEEYGIPNFVHQDIVVVTVNYRLGAYGFLCLDSPLLPGNQGLKDQHEALLWVKRNIKAFGGDPNNVTLGGLSAGAISAVMHLYSPREKLFHKIFSQSGVPHTERLYGKGDPNGALRLAEYLGFSTNDTAEALGFLSKTSADIVVAATKEMGLKTTPCKESKFEGIEIFAEGDALSMSNPSKFRNTPIMLGNTEKEVATIIFYNYFIPKPYDQQPFQYKLAQYFDFDNETMKEAETFVRNFYIGDDAILTPDVQPALYDLTSDLGYNYPIQKNINDLLQVDTGDIYHYVFNYAENGVLYHGYDINYIFKRDSEPVSEERQLIIDRFTSLVSNFIKTGNPTPEVSDLVPFLWTPVSRDSRPYIVVDTDIRLESRYHKERTALWDLVYLAYDKYNKFTNDRNTVQDP